MGTPMKVGTTRKVKYRSLKALLGWPEWQVNGLLTTIWGVASTSAVHGDIGRFTDSEIANAMDMELPIFTTALSAMIETKWIDRHPERRLVIHDWFDHCEQWVKKSAGSKPWEPSEVQTSFKRTQTYADVREVVSPILSSPCLTSPLLPSPTPMAAEANVAGKWDGSIPHAYRQQLVDLWNSAKPKGARPGALADLRGVNDAIWDVERDEGCPGRLDPLEWIVGQMRAYLASREVKTHPTSLRNFIDKRKFMETADQWNHSGGTDTTDPKANGYTDPQLKRLLG